MDIWKHLAITHELLDFLDPMRASSTFRRTSSRTPAHGLGFLHAVASTLDECDRYQGYQTLASERPARAHPGDELARQILPIPRRSAIR